MILIVIVIEIGIRNPIRITIRIRRKKRRRACPLAHEKLEVYQLSLRFAKFVLDRYDTFHGKHLDLRNQLARASQSIVLNIAEGNGRWGPRDRASFFRTARGSALECAGGIDILAISDGLSLAEADEAKQVLERIVGMLTKLILAQGDSAREAAGRYGTEDPDRDPDRDRDRDVDQDHDQDHDHDHGADEGRA